MIKTIDSSGAPVALGPYSHAVKAGNMIYTAGQIPLDPDTEEIVEGGIREQTEQVMLNLANVLAEAGASFKDVVKATVYLKNLSDFYGMNLVYAQFLEDHRPARACVEVNRIPKDALIEIDLIAIVNNETY